MNQRHSIAQVTIVGGVSNQADNLQLLYGACNSTKGNGTQAQLISRLRAQGVLQ